jgi:NitT/TauT family transport system ATP-binding protein
VLALRNIAKIFPNGVQALADLNFELTGGEFASLLGPSGCGKSTVLRIISGLTEPTSGKMEWLDSARGPQQLGYVFQEPTLMPWASIARNVALPLKLQGWPENAEKRVSEALARVGLTEFEGVYPRELSGGMKMRVSIARGLVTKPRLLLMDEPFAALDEITRFRLNDDLLKLWQQERFTVVFVTHSVFESVFLSNRIVVMAARPGRVFREIAVDAPHPRDDAFRTSPEYAELCRETSGVLGEAITLGGGVHDGH